MKTVLLSAGDLSGERHAAELVRALRTRQSQLPVPPGLRFVGMGGAAMAKAGVELAVDQRRLAVGGILEVAGSLPRVIASWRRMKRVVRETDPDVVVLVDSGGFNLPFARWIRANAKAKILYYVAPQVWAWRPRRIGKLVARTDRIAVILPFESSFYAKHGIEVDYVGHPAMDAFDPQHATAAREAARARLGLDSRDFVLGIFPGSRRNELTRHLPIQLAAFGQLIGRNPEVGQLKGMVGLAPNLNADQARALVADVQQDLPGALEVVDGGDGDLIDACDLALVKPGTITIELMLRHIPMVVMGRVHPVTAMMARRSLRIDWLAMPNLIAGEEIVPELIQESATKDRIAAALAPLCRGDARDRQVEALKLTRRRLGPSGAAERTARIVEELLGATPA